MGFVIQHKLEILNPKLEIEINTEHKLIKGIKAGNRVAQKDLYQKYFGQMIGIALRYTRNKEEAYEVLNDAFMKVFNNIEQYNGNGKLGGWIYKIVLNTTFQYTRKNYKIQTFKTEIKPKDIKVENDAISNMGLELIYSQIQKLPDAHRMVFSMYVLDGLKHKAIASKLKISEGTSKWYLATARKQLQELLKQSS